MSDTIELNCGKCGQKMRLHKPNMTRMDDGAISVVIMSPSWSPEERKCPGCGYIVAPVFAQELPIAWMALPPAQKQPNNRIIAPGPLPLDMIKRLKTG